MTTFPGNLVRAVAALLFLSVLTALTACEPIVVVERDAGPRIPERARWAWSPPDADGLAPDEGDVQPTLAVTLALLDAIAAELEARGHRRTTVDSADFFVHFHLGQRVVTDTLPPLESRSRAAGSGDSGGWGGYGSPEAMGARTVSWQEGMLIIDALRAADGSVAWRGVIAGEVKPAEAADPAPALRRAVGRLLGEFP